MHRLMKNQSLRFRHEKIVEEPVKGPLKRRPSAEHDLSDFEEQPEPKKRDEKMVATDRSHHSPPESRSKSRTEVKKNSIKHEPEEVKTEPEEVVEKREKTPEPSQSPQKPVIEEPGTFSVPILDRLKEYLP